jgi:hypothetical protein
MRSWRMASRARVSVAKGDAALPCAVSWPCGLTYTVTWGRAVLPPPLRVERELMLATTAVMQ